MMVKLLFLLSSSLFSLISTTPLKPRSLDNQRVLYDQRQEGEWNVNANLENFVILIIPTQNQSPPPVPPPNSSTSAASGGYLLDFLSRAIPRRPFKRFNHHYPKKHQASPSVNEERTNQHFIESKTAPYHVDISSTKSHLAKLHPDAAVIEAEEIVLAKSPSVELVKDDSNRPARTFVLTAVVPQEEKVDVEKSTEENSGMKLLGAENEQCGPGLERDGEGICRVVKNN